MKVGYFKVKPSVPTISSPGGRALSLTPDRKLTASPRSRWALVTLPITGFVLALTLVGSLQVGVKLTNYDFPRERYVTVTNIDLPENVFFVASAYDSIGRLVNDYFIWGQGAFANIVINWRIFFGLDEAPINTPVVALATTTDISLLREQLRQQIISEINASSTRSVQTFGGYLPSDKPVYAVVAVPTSGSSTVDEGLRQNLKQIFADRVDIRFDSTGRTGIVTPIYSNGQRGRDYVFALTPAR